MATAETRAGSAEADLRKSQSEKAALESKLRASETRVVDLQKQVAAATVAGGSDSKEKIQRKLKSQLLDTRRRMEAVEKEKGALAEKLKEAQDRVTAMEEEKTKRS